MTPADDAPDDDRTVIRPPGATQALGKTVAAPPPFAPTAMPTMERTLAAGAPPAFEPDIGNGLPVGTYLGEFEVTSMLGEGGFGIVYLATDHSLQRRVALKEYMPSALAARVGTISVQVKSERHRETFEAGRKSFVNEARLLAQFDHPSLVKVYRFWEANGTAYMVMPFYEGKTLKDTLREMRDPPSEDWLKTVLAPLTEALSVIHAEQCYHRDIAPDNVMMLAGSHRPLLLDFGAARRVIGDMTQALTVILKPGYAPVEQYAEIPGMKQGAWTDVYALAAVVYFAITGRTPPPSVGRLLNDTYVPLAQAAAGRYSAGFLEAVDRALAVRPETRTQAIGQLRDELGLGAFAPVDPYTTKPLPPGAVPPRPPPQMAAAPRPAMPPPLAAAPAARKSGALVGVAGGVVALAAVGAGAYYFLTPAPRAPAPPPAVLEAAAPSPPPTAVAAAPPAAAPAAPAPAPAGLDPLREFERMVQAQTPGFGVQAKADKSVFRIDRDDIAFSVQTDRDGYLYVFAASAEGELVLMVPNATSGAVKLRKGQRYHFPTGDGVVLTAADPPGPVQLLAFVASLQRDFSALEPKPFQTMRLFPTGAAAAAVVARLGADRPLLAGRAICPASGSCDEDFGAAVMRFETAR